MAPVAQHKGGPITDLEQTSIVESPNRTVCMLSYDITRSQQASPQVARDPKRTHELLLFFEAGAAEAPLCGLFPGLPLLLPLAFDLPLFGDGLLDFLLDTLMLLTCRRITSHL